MKPTLVRGDGYQGNGRSGGPGYWPRGGRGRGNGNGNWNGRGNWNGNAAGMAVATGTAIGYGRHYRRGHSYGHPHNYYGNSGLYLGLGLGALGLRPWPTAPATTTTHTTMSRCIGRAEFYPGAASSHEEWCYNRYRSYRDWDNTFQPYHGPRRQCHSPFG